MTQTNNYAEYSDEQLDIIHSTSEKFETALNSVSQYRIEDLLDGAPAALKTPLLRELLAIEIQWRAGQATLIPIEDYLKRFPTEDIEIRRMYGEVDLAKRDSDNAHRPSSSVALPCGTLVADRYSIVELIGEGGMGSVYLAEQTQPVRRKVALKLIKGGMDSQSVLRRFDAERQALAIMDHPSIAKVYDGGTWLHGQPYFAMELVPGLPITNYCDTERFSIRQRLKLFIQVAEAVQHAHMKGIIHRDLKPANIIVSTLDDRPLPKVIDFGVAKAIEQKLTDQSVGSTAFIVGTPAYMSPEQADPTTMDIDTRTDVYSLGVILYELLAGSPPHEPRSSSGGAVAELLRMVRDSDSPRPSSKVSVAVALPTIAANRSIEPRKLTQLLRSELDWIVLKSLNRDRSQRYETANALARDIQRYLDGEIVEAQPPSASYRFRKIAIRFKRYVIAGGLLLFALLSGIIGTTWGLLEAQKQERIAIAETQKKELALQSVVRERDYAESLAEFVSSDLLALTTLEGRLDFDGANSGLTKDSTLGDLLQHAVVKLDERTDLEPQTEARLRWMIGRSLYYQGDYQKSIDLYQRSYDLYLKSLGPDHLLTFGALDGLIEALHKNGKYELARPLTEDSLNRRTALHGEAHLETLKSISLLAQNVRGIGEPAKSVPLFERTLELRKKLLGPEAHDTLTNMYDLAMAYIDADQRDKAKPLVEQTLALQTATLGDEHPDTNASMGLLARLHREAGQFNQAIPLQEREVEWTKAHYGEGHPKNIFAIAGLAACYRDAGKTEQAIALFEQALAMVLKTFGEEHPNTANAMSSLAMAYRAADDHIRALPYFEKALELRKKILKDEHPYTINSMINVASCYKSMNRLEDSQEMNQLALALAQRVLGDDHNTTLTLMQNIAINHWKAKNLDLSIPLLQKVLAFKESRNGRKHPDTLQVMANLGVNYRDANRLAEAIPLMEESYASSTDKPSLDFVGPALLEAYLLAGKAEEASSLLTTVVTTVRAKNPASSVSLADKLAPIGNVLVRSSMFAASDPILRECLDIRMSQEPDHWKTFQLKASLGASLLRQNKIDEAEAGLLDAYNGLKAKSSDGALVWKERLMSTIDDLIELYGTLPQTSDAIKWADLRNELRNRQ